MLNQQIDTWTIIGAMPEPDRPVWILVEHDVVHDVDVEAPFVRKAVARFKAGGIPEWTWHLLDFDPDTEEEVLQQVFTVVAWRYV